MDVTEIKEALPVSLRKSVNSELLGRINDVMQDETLAEEFRNSFLSYSKVLQEGKFKIQSYVDAIRYVCYKMQDRTNFESYSLTFPDKMQKFAQEGKSNKDISAYVAAFHKNKLVTRIMEEALTPMWILNRDNYQKAINTQIEIMQDSKSDIARVQAANSILTNLKQPETKKIELDVGIKEDGVMASLIEQTNLLAQKQLEALQSGLLNAKDVAQTKILEGEATRED